MLNRKYFIFLIFLYTSFVSAMDLEAVEIMALLKGKHYKTAVRLLEKAIVQETDNRKKGYYAFVLNQIPDNITMTQPRYKYAYMAARWALNIPRSKRILLWVESGDGFFHKGFLKEGEYCYKKAMKLMKNQKNKNKLSYIQYKRAWIYVNEKEWKKAFDLLVLSTRTAGKLKSNIFFDLGKVWSESQRSEHPVPLNSLQNVMQTVSRRERVMITDGIIQGIIRSMKDDITSVATVLSQNKELSTNILNTLVSSDKVGVFVPCELLPWVEEVNINQLKSKTVLPVLNSCVQTLTQSKGKKTKIKHKNLKSLVRLYSAFKRKGVKRWPMVLAYEHLGWRKKACEESIKQFTEVAEQMISIKDNDVIKSAEESARLCQTQKPHSALVGQLVKTVFSSEWIALKYKDIEGSFESDLFNLFNSPSFRSSVKKEVLKAWKSKWMKRDLFPNLVLSGIQSYQSEELKTFLYQWASLPVSGIYLDILKSRRKGLSNEKDLDHWLPLKRVKSYASIVPWIKQSLSNPLQPKKQKVLVNKVLEYFPSRLKDQKKAASFLSLHFLKTDQLSEIFKYWKKLNIAFSNKHLAVELFEKSVYGTDKYCPSIIDLSMSSKQQELFSFIQQSCLLLSENNQSIHKIKIPKVLLSSLLAQDLAVLRLIHNKTLRLKKGISNLEYRTAPMVLGLRKSIVNFHKRKWRLNAVQSRCQNLIQNQIVLFRNELNKLSKSSLHSEQYIKLATILDGWRASQ